MAFQTVRYTVQEGIAEIELHRPQQLNTYNTVMRDELWTLFQAVRDDDSLRLLLLTGAGRGFSAGADLTEFGSFPSVMQARWIRQKRDVWGLMARLKPVIVVAAHGFCLGDGLEMALLADFRIAAEGTVFALPETSLGFLPGAGGSQLLPRVIGERRALQLLLSGQRLEAQEAKRWGLVQRVLADDAFHAHVRAGLRHWLDHCRLDPRRLKRAVVFGGELPQQDGLNYEKILASGGTW